MAEILKNFSTSSTGWFFMWTLLTVAVFMVAIAIERAYYIMVRSNINAPRFMAEIRKLVKGGDYKVEEIAGGKEVIEAGGEVKVLNFEQGISTTQIINTIRLED